MNEWVKMRGGLAAGLLLVACGPSSGDEPTATDLAGLAEQNVEQALRGAHRAGSFVADSATVAQSLSSLSPSTEYCVTDCSGVDPCTETCTPEDNSVSVDDLQRTRDDLNADIDSLVKTLKEKIFTQANLESDAGGAATYRLGPSTLCASSSSAVSSSSSGGAQGSTTSSETMLDPDCVDQVNQLEPRLRLSSPSAGNVDVDLLLTSAKHDVATLELYKDRVGVVIDLGAIKATLDEVGQDTGTLTSMVGKLGFDIVKNADLDFSLRANVIEAVTLGVENQDGEAATYSLGASVPTFELRLDGNARKVTGSMDLGALEVKGPLNAFRDTFDPETYDQFGDPLPRPTYTGAVDALLAGLEGSLTLDGKTDVLTFSHLGLGDASSTLKVDGNTLAQLDVNPTNGRHFDLNVKDTDAGTDLTFSPTFDASVLLNFAPLADQIADIAPDLMNNTLHLWFDGENPSIEASANQVKVLAGTLNYTSSYDPSANLSVAAGMCVGSAPDTGDGTSGMTGLAVTTCQ